MRSILRTGSIPVIGISMLVAQALPANASTDLQTPHSMRVPHSTPTTTVHPLQAGGCTYSGAFNNYRTCIIVDGTGLHVSDVRTSVRNQYGSVGCSTPSVSINGEPYYDGRQVCSSSNEDDATAYINNDFADGTTICASWSGHQTVCKTIHP